MNFGSRGNYLVCKGTRESKESLNFRGVIFFVKIFCGGFLYFGLKPEASSGSLVLMITFTSG